MLHWILAALPALAPAPQDPVPPAAPGGETAPVAMSREEASGVLRRVELAGKAEADLDALTDLLAHPDPAVAGRAAWLLGEWLVVDRAADLAECLGNSQSAEVRLQALAALDRLRDDSTTPAIVAATTDADVAVRALAVQAVVHRGADVGVAPLLALVERNGKTASTDGAPDVASALVGLADLRATESLLAAARSVRFTSNETGTALAFLFQSLSPRLASSDEATTLVAVLAHPEPLLRRYAIQRLGELRDPATAPALEARLATEAEELQPLVRVSLEQVRGEVIAPADLAERAKHNALALARMLEREWNSMRDGTKISAGAAAGVFALGIAMIVVARRRTRRAEAAREAAALVAPSTPAPAGRAPLRAGWRDAPRPHEAPQETGGNRRW